MSLPHVDANALAVLRQRPRRAGEASFFFQDTGFGRAAVKVLPGEFFVYDHDVAVNTTLGSCVAACLHDPGAGIGGMNHFMLPEGAADAGGRFGAFAMELLINEMIKRGARKGALQAKIFGGGQVMKSLARTEIGEKNVAFVRNFLAQEGIPVLASDVLGEWPRKVCLFPRSGQVLCKRLPAASASESVQQEETYRRRLVQAPRGGDVELFS
ncbi:chemoreceptor glutamine deamidase CheD [Ramlibacter sp. MAHUQ-53]|uniref:chemoreceptor glutamine deamidase CheD n=1 Tax=unclassified Ramlibacter TaxID=2617605 RepID=UPI0036297C76